MADEKPKKKAVESEAAVPQTAEPSIHEMRRVDLVKEVEVQREKNKAIERSKDQLEADFKKELDVVSKQNEEMTTKRDSLLEQLQQEMSKNEALRQQLLEQKQSQQSVLDYAMEQNAIRMQEMSLQIEELTNQFQGLNDEMQNLTEELDQMNEENSCPICLSPWEALGDHRVVSLSCGHLFGKICIREHLEHNPECPLCKQTVCYGDTRYIFDCPILPGYGLQAQTSYALQIAPAAPPGQPVQIACPCQQWQPTPLVLLAVPPQPINPSLNTQGYIEPLPEGVYNVYPNDCQCYRY